MSAHKTKTGEFIIYAFLLFKQPYVPRYIKRVIDRGTRTISSICAKLLVSYPKTMYQVISIRSTTTPCTHSSPPSVVIFQHPPVLMQSAPRHSLLVTSTRGWQHDRAEGKRSTLCRQGGGIADRPSLARIFFSSFSFPFFFYFLFLFFYHTHAATSSTPTFCPSSPLFGLCASIFFLFLFLFVLFLVYSKPKGKEE